MATSCITTIAADFLRDCDNKPTAGIKQNVLLFNQDDIQSFTFSSTSPSTIIEGVNLKAGTKGYFFEGVKTIMNATTTLVSDDTSENGLTHAINNLRNWNTSADDLNTLNAILSGAKFVGIVEYTWAGADKANAFRVYGVSHGMEVATQTHDSNADAAQTPSGIATPSTLREPYQPHLLQVPPTGGETIYEATKALFDARFEAPAAPTP